MNKVYNDNPAPKNGTVHTGKLKPGHGESTSLLLSSEPQHKRILVVDDNPDIVFTLRVALESDPAIQVYCYDNPVTRGNERIGTVVIEKNVTIEAAKEESKYLIDRSLAKICFAFNTEASISQDGYYFVDLENSPNSEHVEKSVTMRTSNAKEDPNNVFVKMDSIGPDKQDILDLALAYYKMGEYKNPLRIKSFFSSMTVLVRDIWKNKLTSKDEVTTKFLKEKVKLVLMNRNTFDEAKFCEQWKECYADERCSIVHGRGSKLIDPRTIYEYDKITNIIHYWAREMLYYYINHFQNPN